MIVSTGCHLTSNRLPRDDDLDTVQPSTPATKTKTAIRKRMLLLMITLFGVVGESMRRSQF